MKTIFAIAATLIAASQATVVFAQSIETIKVSYSDLNIHSPEGAVKLDRRIGNAARIVCGHDSAFDLKSRAAAARCETKARNEARAQIASLTAVNLAAR
jgi:UrcA family protein